MLWLLDTSALCLKLCKNKTVPDLTEESGRRTKSLHHLGLHRVSTSVAGLFPRRPLSLLVIQHFPIAIDTKGVAVHMDKSLCILSPTCRIREADQRHADSENARLADCYIGKCKVALRYPLQVAREAVPIVSRELMEVVDRAFATKNTRGVGDPLSTTDRHEYSDDRHQIGVRRPVLRAVGRHYDRRLEARTHRGRSWWLTHEEEVQASRRGPGFVCVAGRGHRGVPSHRLGVVFGVGRLLAVNSIVMTLVCLADGSATVRLLGVARRTCLDDPRSTASRETMS